jgi:hypothetical protein
MKLTWQEPPPLSDLPVVLEEAQRFFLSRYLSWPSHPLASFQDFSALDTGLRAINIAGHRNRRRVYM